MDHFRNYKVWIDGRCVGKVRDSGSWSGALPAGRHVARCSIDWAKTNEVTFVVEPDRPVRLHVQLGSTDPAEFVLGRHIELLDATHGTEGILTY